ncbi:MAG TPA: hypothetical protein VLA22_03470 [Gaiellaceae bacterium]|nr:hypothetical protein [Gaiellaceae bacterium]
MRRKLLVAIGVALLAIAAAGCGGGDDAETTTEATPASEWADGFCTAVSTWQSAIEDISGRFTSLSSLSRENLQAAADDANSATDELIEEIRALGAPDTQSGEEIEASIDDLGSTLETELDSIQATLDETSGITELPGALKDVSSSITAMTTAFSDTYSTIRDAGAEDELRDALESSSACDDIPN